MNKVEKYKEYCCDYCDNYHSCCDLDGCLITEQVKICMDANAEIVKQMGNDE